MKNIKLLFAAVSVITVFSFSQCKKNKDKPQLPAETTIGAMTFGCKINGLVFLPKDGRGHPGLYVQYVNLGTGPRGDGILTFRLQIGFQIRQKDLISEQIAYC